MKTPTLFIRKSIQSLALGLVALAMMQTTVARAEVSDELDGLGSSKQAAERAARLESRTRIGIVQGRAVDRHWRVEIGANYGPVAYGDPYVSTQNAGANLDLHINPKFSLGVHYAHAFNQLTDEGQSRFDQARRSAQTSGDYSIPQVSYPEQSVMGVINWYMTYGKLNFFDWKTVQFDIYSLAGAGQVQVSTQLEGKTQTSWTSTWTAGGGVGFWLTQHVTSRFELRYQSYADKIYSGSRDLNLVMANFGIGVLL